MNRLEDSALRPPAHATPAIPVATLADIGFACLGEGCGPGQGAEADWLLQRRERLGAPGSTRSAGRAEFEARARAALARWLRDPPAADHALHALARHQRLTLAETMAVALSRASELHPMAARALIWLQQPVGETRPTLGLLATLCAALGEADGLATLAGGAARAHGLIQLAPEDRPLCERSVRLALPIVLALEGREGNFDGVELRTDALPVLAPSALEAARRHAEGLARAEGGARVLVIRAALDREARAAATRVAEALGARPAFIAGDPPPGLGPWLWLRRRLPVLCIRSAPGDQHRLPEIAGHRGPLLVATGSDGGFEASGAITQWRLPVPPLAERVQLWQHSLGDALAPAAIEALAHAHRHGAGRIVELAQAARSAAACAGEALAGRHVGAVARSGVGAELGALAELLDEDIADDALVLVPALREALDALLVRCRLRDTLADALGRAARTRYRPGVRALFVGPSGTGKTLAAGWVATRLGLPCSGSTWPRSPASTSAKPKRTSPSSSPAPATPRWCCCSTRRTRCSASAPTSRTPTTASPTSRPTTCCSASRATTASSCSPATAAHASTRPSPGGWTPSSTFPLPARRSAAPSGSPTSATPTPSTPPR